MKIRLLIAVWVAALSVRAATDLVIYGGTSAGVIAAVQAKKMGKSVVIVCPEKHLGGLSSGGLGFTDTGDKAVIGGLAREFYHRVWLHYDQPTAWTQQKREEYGNKGQGTPAMDGAERTMWIFEPHVAEQIFEEFIKENQIPVYRDEWLDRAKGVAKDGARITAITMLSGKTFTGKMFIDATYEGDLMAATGVEFTVGREAMKTYDEKWNGVQVGVLHHRHHFGTLKEKISPYVVPGDPKSGVLPHVSAAPPGEYGASDNKVQAFCFRMCLTDRPENRIPFPKPTGYDPKQYELLARIYAAGWKETFEKFDPIPNRKTDTNNHGPMSTDDIGANYDYPNATYERRREIIAEHKNYQQGWLYFIAHDPRVPAEVQKEMQRWGLPKDEFTDNGGWSHQLYIREARRMVGRYVMTENELLKRRPTPEPVGMGSYGMDSHNVQRYITPEGYVQNEGDIGVSTKGPYAISFGALVPKAGQADNLLVPVCVSSSHIAYGSIRMEPVFMILGQSAVTAACLALADGVNVQSLVYAKLRARLLADGQVLDWQNDKTAPAPRTTPSLPDMRSIPADLVIPPLTDGPPVAGARVKHFLPEYQGTQVYHVLYLPTDWRPGARYPVIVEYAGNGGFTNKYTDVSTGLPENSQLGYGISSGKGFIWLCLPFVDVSAKKIATHWWGDVDATVAYCKKAVQMVCAEFDGDPAAVILTGFSRGAIACGYIGLHDDDIAGLWRAFIPYSHYDGVRQWPYPASDASAAIARMQRLRGRPSFVCQEGSVADTQQFIAASGVHASFKFQVVPFRNHNDGWILRPSSARTVLRKWLQEVLSSARSANPTVSANPCKP